MKNRLLYPLLLLLMSCHQAGNGPLLKETEDNELILLEYDYCNKKAPSHECDSIVFVPLETNEASLMSGVDKLLYRNGVYYILDRSQAMIFLFDSKGSYITKINSKGSAPGEYADISDFDLDGDQNIYVSSLLGRKIIKYECPEYKSFTEYPTDAPVMEIAVGEKTGEIWGANVFQAEGAICLGLYSDGKFIPVIPSRGIADKAETPLKVQSFYKSDNCLLFNPRYSPYVYQIEGGKVSKYMKIVSDSFMKDSDLEEKNKTLKTQGPAAEYFTNECLVSGVRSLYQCKGHFLGEIWKNTPLPLLLEYDTEKGSGSLFNPLLNKQIKTYTKIAGVSSDFYISHVNAASFLKHYEDSMVSKYQLSDDSNPLLMKIYLK